MLKTWILFFFIAFQLHASPSDRGRRAQIQLEGFDQVIQKALLDYQVPGLAIGVLVDGELIYSQGFGYRDLEKKTPVTPSTVFPIGSCSKAFTAFLFGTLVDEGIIAWDTRLIDLYPEFRLWDSYATQNLNLRDLLTHRSGVPRHDFMWYNSLMDRAELISRLRYLESSSEIRERYQYNNLMYVAASFAVEQLLNRSWEDLISSRILLPLNMKNTSFSIEEMKKGSDFAYGSIEKNKKLKSMPLRDMSLIAPAGGLNSNVLDLARWVQMHLDGGEVDGTPCINPVTLQEICSPQIVITGVPESHESLIYTGAIGWKVVSYRGQYFLSHDGVADGFTSVIGILPQQGIGVIVLANKNLTPAPRYISMQAIDRVLELPPIDWIQEGLDGFAKNKASENENPSKDNGSRKQGTSPSHSLQDYVGEYEHPGYGTVRMALVGGKLQMTLHGITSILDHWHYDVFNIAQELQDLLFSREGTKVSFSQNVHGNIEELSIPFEPQTHDIVFKKKPERSLSDVDYIRQFIGVYEIYGYTVEVAIRNHKLVAIIPGEPVYELTPTSLNEFGVKSSSGYTTVRFVLEEAGPVKEVLLIQPYGTFKAKPKRGGMNGV